MHHTRYSMIIECSDDDQTFIVTIPDLPGARSHAGTYDAAAAEGQRLIEEWLEIARERGWTLPQSAAARRRLIDTRFLASQREIAASSPSTAITRLPTLS